MSKRVVDIRQPAPIKMRLKKLSKESVFDSWFEMIFTYMLIAAGFCTVGVFGFWWFSVGHVPSNFSGLFHIFDFLLFILLSFVVWYQVINEMLSWEVALFMKKPKFLKPSRGLRVALCTAFVPGKEPYDILERTLYAMTQVRYPHDTWLLDEGDDLMAKQLCERYGVFHFTRYEKEFYNREGGKYTKKTKAGNYNSWFDQHGWRYDIVAQHDVDFTPMPNYLYRTLGYFADPEVAFVGTPQIYGNENESWIAKGAAEQAYGFYGPMQKGLFGHDMHLFIGANHIIRTEAHHDIFGYSGHIVEDHLTGMRLYANKWKGVYVPEKLLIGEGPSTWAAYFSQQMRWAYGLMDILFRHSPKIVPDMKRKHGLHYFLLQQFYFYGIAQAIGIFLISLYFIFGIQSTSMELLTLLILYPLFLIMQILIFLWLQRFYVDKQNESGFHVRAKILNIAAWPVYFWAFISAVIGKRLNYEVTPKGAAQTGDHPPRLALFRIHFIFGVITFIDLLIGYSRGNFAPQIVFWAILNTLFMFGFIAVAMWQNVLSMIRNYFAHIHYNRQKDHLIEAAPLFE